MTLTVCVGASGSGKMIELIFMNHVEGWVQCVFGLLLLFFGLCPSPPTGKTTFLNDVHKSHKCTYIRQYHNLRPYIAVSAIANFDPTKVSYRGKPCKYVPGVVC